ncbi:MAG: NAD(P)-dependent oxidoreductase [Treponema sp.]|nr:NAD(P)-dependent oxidoreductase [Treponema sp.]
MKVLVTGAFGNVGRSTIKALAEGGITISVLETDTADNRRLAPRLSRRLGLPGSQAISATFFGDVRDPGLVARAVAGQDAIIHLAAIIPPEADRQPALARSINIEGTATLIEAARKQAVARGGSGSGSGSVSVSGSGGGGGGGGSDGGSDGGAEGPQLPRFVLASSIAAYGDRLRDFWIRTSDPLVPSPGDEYGQTKVEAEALVRASGLPFSILRLTYIVWRKKLRRDPLMFHMPLSTRIEICHTEDTGRAFAAAVVKDEALGRTFDIGGGESCRTNYRDYLDAMFRLFGLGGFGSVPEGAFATSGFHCGWFADSDEAEKVLGFRRKTLADYYVEVAEEAGWKRLAATLFRPLVRASLAWKSPFLRRRQAVRIRA